GSLLGAVEPADRQTLHGGHALLGHLLRGSGKEVDKQGGDRQKRDEPIEPVERRRTSGALTCIADGSSSGCGHPGRLARGSSRRPRRTAKRVEPACSTQPIAEACGQPRSNIILLA